jgi:hypothetical protein
MLYTYSSWAVLLHGVKAGKGTDKGTVVPVHALNAYGWKRGRVLPILDPGTRWVQLGRFTPCPFYFCGKNTLYPLNRRLGGPHSQSKHALGAEYLLLLSGIKPWIIHPTLRHSTTSPNIRNIK